MLVPLKAGVQEYRMRCDLCRWSGPWPAFITGEGTWPLEAIDVCERCMGDELVVRDLLNCGWRFK